MKITLNPPFNKKHYQPNEEISGKITWNPVEVETDDLSPITFNLLYSSLASMMSDPQVEVIESVDFPYHEGKASFKFTLPSSPLTFHGALIKLTWALEVHDPNQQEAKRHEFIVSSTGSTHQLEPQKKQPVGIVKI